jgi:hypothetical protein
MDSFLDDSWESTKKKLDFILKNNQIQPLLLNDNIYLDIYMLTTWKISDYKFPSRFFKKFWENLIIQRQIKTIYQLWNLIKEQIDINETATTLSHWIKYFNINIPIEKFHLYGIFDLSDIQNINP